MYKRIGYQLYILIISLIFIFSGCKSVNKSTKKHKIDNKPQKKVIIKKVLVKKKYKIKKKKLKKAVCIPVLCYHQIGRGKHALSISVNAFKRQMRYLYMKGFKPITPYDLLKFLQNKHAKLPAKPVIITFDDAWKSQYTNALPILLKYSFKAVFFIAPSALKKYKGVKYPPKNLFSRKMIIDLHKKGFIIASHSYYHVNLIKLKNRGIFFEYKASKKWIEKLTGKRVIFFAFPYGAYNEKTLRIAKKCGYKALFTTNKGVIHKKSNPLLLNRFMVMRYHSIKAFTSFVNSKPLIFNNLSHKDGGFLKANKIILSLQQKIELKNYRLIITHNGKRVNNFKYNRITGKLIFKLNIRNRFNMWRVSFISKNNRHKTMHASMCFMNNIKNNLVNIHKHRERVH
jgi:peptidoglycan/xylan/chitin deacetylase (PgdA/CDA1 family)